MLDDFALEQKIAYKSFKNAVINNKVSHAYIIEANGYPMALDFAKSFVKYLLCPQHYTHNNNCKNCFQCVSIDNNDFIEFKLIEAEGQWIKKAQLDELQTLFSKKAIIGNRKVYIINNAEKLNVSSSNSLLKFLEEPEDGIVAILVTNNINQLLPTIVSRCQIFSLKNTNKNIGSSTIEKIALSIKNNTKEINEFVAEEKNQAFIEKIIDFIDFYEKEKLNTLIYYNKLILDEIKLRENMLDAFEIVLLFYKDVLNNKIGKSISIFNDYIEYVKKVSEKNKIEVLISKINVIINLEEKIKFNINNNLLIDKLIIELERCENND